MTHFVWERWASLCWSDPLPEMNLEMETTAIISICILEWFQDNFWTQKVFNPTNISETVVKKGYFLVEKFNAGWLWFEAQINGTEASSPDFDKSRCHMQRTYFWESAFSSNFLCELRIVHLFLYENDQCFMQNGLRAVRIVYGRCLDSNFWCQFLSLKLKWYYTVFLVKCQ